jgi:hypothetical protein
MYSMVENPRKALAGGESVVVGLKHGPSVLFSPCGTLHSSATLQCTAVCRVFRCTNLCGCSTLLTRSPAL